MHIAFVSLGAFGHINPTLALVTELVKKGVRVTYFTTEAFRTIIGKVRRRTLLDGGKRQA